MTAAFPTREASSVSAAACWRSLACALALSACVSLSAPMALAAPPQALEERPQGPTDEKVTLDFHKTPLEQVVRFFSELTQRNFIIDGALSGKTITIMAPSPVTPQEAWGAFMTALQMNEMTLVRHGRFYKLYPAEEGAQQAPLQMGSSRQGDGMKTRRVPLTHAQVADVERVLGRLASAGATIVADPRTNSLIIVERPANMRRLMEVVEALDKPGAAQEVMVIPLQHADADEVARILRAVIE